MRSRPIDGLPVRWLPDVAETTMDAVRVEAAMTGVVAGRDDEIERLVAFVERRSARVLFLHGVAGMGKSTLLRALALRLAPGAEVVIHDCREIEPTPAGFLAAIAQTAHGLSLTDQSGEVAAPLPDGAGPRSFVVCLDQYEVLRLLDTWIRTELVPRLPESCTLVIAGREKPHPAWNRLPASSFETMLLGPLRRPDAAALVHRLGVDGDHVSDIVRLAGGHPLSLVIGSLAVREGPVRRWSDVTIGRLLDEFTAAYFDDLSERDVHLLEAAAVVRRVTKPLLAALGPDTDPEEGFATLRAMPFVDLFSDGLAIHESIQRTVSAQLLACDPDRYRTLRRRAWEHLRSELRDIPGRQIWRHTADMVYLVDDPAVREAHFPSGAHTFAIEAAVVDDGPAIHAIIGRHEPPEAADLLRIWWERHPTAFRIARGVDGGVAGFSIITTATSAEVHQHAWDPIATMWLDHLAEHPIPPSQVVILIRRWLTWEHGELPCEAQASLWLDLKRTYMELRPRLRRNYGATGHPEVFGPVMEGICGGRIAGPGVIVGNRCYHGLYLEFGPSSVDGWLSRLAAKELGLTDDDLLDVNHHQVIVGGTPGGPDEAGVRSAALPSRASRPAGHPSRSARRHLGLRRRHRIQRGRRRRPQPPHKAQRRRITTRDSARRRVPAG